MGIKGRKVIITIIGIKAMTKKLLTVSTRGKIEYKEQSGSKQVNSNKEIRISVHKSRKITTTTESAKLMVKKQLMTSAKRVLEKDVQDMSIKKVWT